MQPVNPTIQYAVVKEQSSAAPVRCRLCGQFSRDIVDVAEIL